MSAAEPPRAPAARKLFVAARERILQALSARKTEVVGKGGLLDENDDPVAGESMNLKVESSSVKQRIYGGTDLWATPVQLAPAATRSIDLNFGKMCDLAKVRSFDSGGGVFQNVDAEQKNATGVDISLSDADTSFSAAADTANVEQCFKPGSKDIL